MIEQRFYYIHRLAWFYVHGEWPIVVDHINRDTSDNRIANLRAANQSINSHNRREQANNTSGQKGVVFDKRSGKWNARIKIKGRTFYGGDHVNFEDAVVARRKLEARFGLAHIV